MIDLALFDPFLCLEAIQEQDKLTTFKIQIFSNLLVTEDMNIDSLHVIPFHRYKKCS